MAIATNDQLTAALATGTPATWYKAAATAEAAGTYFSYARVAGMPGAKTTEDSNSRITSTWQGFMSFTTATGTNTQYIGAFSIYAALAGVYCLYDRVWQSTWMLTSAETVSTVGSTYWGRDCDNTTNGRCVSVWLEFETASTVAVATRTATISYTNSDGTSGRTANLVQAIPATPVAGYCAPFVLQDGDKGVRSVETFVLSSALSTGGGGAAICKLVAQRQLTATPITLANTGADRNFYDIGTKIYDGTAIVPIALCSGTGLGLIGGQIVRIQG